MRIIHECIHVYVNYCHIQVSYIITYSEFRYTCKVEKSPCVRLCTRNPIILVVRTPARSMHYITIRAQPAPTPPIHTDSVPKTCHGSIFLASVNHMIKSPATSFFTSYNPSIIFPMTRNRHNFISFPAPVYPDPRKPILYYSIFPHSEH